MHRQAGHPAAAARRRARAHLRRVRRPEGDLVTGVVQRDAKANAAGIVLVDLGKVEARAAAAEQVPGRELHARPAAQGATWSRVAKGLRGPADHRCPAPTRTWCASCSRSRCPRSPTARVEIAAVAREAGHRPRSPSGRRSPGVNAKGACIGPMGAAGARRDERAARREDRHRRLVGRPGRRSSATRCRPPRSCRSTVVDPRPGRPGSSCPTSSSRWPSARRGRTPGWPPGSPGGGSTSAATPQTRGRRRRGARAGVGAARRAPIRRRRRGRPRATAARLGLRRGACGAAGGRDAARRRWPNAIPVPHVRADLCRLPAAVAANELLRVVVVDGASGPGPAAAAPRSGCIAAPRPGVPRRCAERRRAFGRALRVPGPLDTGAVRAARSSTGQRRRAPGARAPRTTVASGPAGQQVIDTVDEQAVKPPR